MNFAKRLAAGRKNLAKLPI